MKNLEKFLDEQLNDPVFVRSYINELKKDVSTYKATESNDSFYSENNIHYLESIVNDVKNGTAHFNEHDLFDEQDEHTHNT